MGWIEIGGRGKREGSEKGEERGKKKRKGGRNLHGRHPLD